jgi:hypothetical protein
MTALLRGLRPIGGGCEKHERSKKVTGSQDDDFVGVLKKNIARLALMRAKHLQLFPFACSKGKERKGP